MEFKELKIPDYERVVEVKDQASGLHALIALHNTRLGPGLGGIRAWPYETVEEALNDVLRLSRGMTYKSAIVKTGTGGAKSVILTKGEKTRAQLHAFGEAVNLLKGKYICAEDVGISPEELSVICEKTPYGVGLLHAKSSGDPSPFTAHGGFLGIQAVCQFLWGSPSCKGKRIAIQGLGAVGMKLAASLFWAGAHLIVADPHPERTAYAARSFGAKVVGIQEIGEVECDIFAPCALGGILHEESIKKLKCAAVAGLANNQLLREEDGARLQEREILYAPDYVINGGGLLNVCCELQPGGYSAPISRMHLEKIPLLLLELFGIAMREGLSTSLVANRLAERHLEEGPSTSSSRYQETLLTR